MNRKQPGDMVIDSRGTWRIRSDGSFVAFDRERYRDSRAWDRGSQRADKREQVL